jgi:hypothetical protein
VSCRGPKMAGAVVDVIGGGGGREVGNRLVSDDEGEAGYWILL